MYRINHFHIAGFRRLFDVNLPMQSFMAIIGVNGAGKTSFLDSFSLLSASASGKLDYKLSQLGGVSNILTRDKSNEIAFRLGMEIPEYEPLEYTLSLVPQGTGYSINAETLSQKRTGYSGPFKHIDSSGHNIHYYETEKKGMVRVDWEHNHLETSLSQVPKMFRQPEELRRILATAVKYHTLDVGPQAPVKLPQQMKPATTPGINGEDLAAYLYYIRETSRDKFETITDSLKAVFHDFEELNFPPVASGMLTLTWKDRNFTRPLFLHELSEGTLRFLWLISLLQSSALSAITMIDEPDVSLHPEMMHMLSGLMREASLRTQLIIATHSDRFIRFVKPEELFVFDLDDSGCTSAVRADALDLEKWLSEYRLDELWSMGCLKGYL